jgi:serine/threonine protein kinase
MWNSFLENQLKAQRILTCYRGPVNIPRIIRTGSDYIIEELAPGREMSQDLMRELSSEEITGIIEDFAGFLNFIHQHTARVKNSKYRFGSKRFSDDDILGFYSSKLDTADFEAVRQMFETARGDWIVRDQYTVFTHGDLHPKNMLYDRESKTLSIIDFGAAGWSSRYMDICPFAPASLAMYAPLRDLVFAVADAYNSIPKKRFPIYYDKSKIEIIMARGALHELARVSMITGNYAPKCMNDTLRSLVGSGRPGR